MWQFYLTVFLIFFSQSVKTREIIDMTNICRDVVDGDLIANPLDCGSYFKCGIIPTLRYCTAGLHFDAVRRLCNQPELAKCKSFTTTARPSSKPLPDFVAYDVNTNLPTDPMNKYNPNNIECEHYGAYFLPHPNNCRKYYLCAYGYLHQHHCGAGTAWNYQLRACELKAVAKCYNSSAMIVDLDGPSTPATITMATNDNDDDDTTLYHSTICYPVYIPTKPIIPPTTPTTTTNGTTAFVITRPTAARTATPATKTTKTTSTEVETTLTPTVICPADRQIYLPHPHNCQEYYICIAGRAILTYCPYGLYWNADGEYCDLPHLVACNKS